MKNFHKSIPLVLAAPFMLLGGGAMAQDAAPGVGACGQPAALNGQAMNLAVAPTDVTGGLVELRRNEPRYVELTIGTQMPLALATMAADRDMTMILFDSNGALVGSDDDSGVDENAQLIAVLEPGVYCAQIASYGGTDPSSLIVPFSISAAPPPDACIKTSAPAVELSNGSDEIITTGVLSGDVNVAFRLAAGTSVSIAARSPMFDTLLTLEDSFGREIATDDDGGGDTNSLLQVDSGAEAMDYCVTLSALDDESGIYSMSISPTLAAGETAQPGMPDQQQFEAGEAAQDAAAAAAEAAAAVDAAESAAEAAANPTGDTADTAADAMTDAVPVQ